MDLVSNFVGTISPSQFGGNKQNITPNYDLEDNIFSNMLEKQINKQSNQISSNITETFGLPSGLDIGDLDHTAPNFKLNSENEINGIKTNNEFQNSHSYDSNNWKDMSTSEILTFFSSLFESKPTLTDTSKSGLFDFERKLAANQYSKYAKNVVTDLIEFVSDALKLN